MRDGAFYDENTVSSNPAVVALLFRSRVFWTWWNTVLGSLHSYRHLINMIILLGNYEAFGESTWECHCYLLPLSVSLRIGDPRNQLEWKSPASFCHILSKPSVRELSWINTTIIIHVTFGEGGRKSHYIMWMLTSYQQPINESYWWAC